MSFSESPVHLRPPRRANGSRVLTQNLEVSDILMADEPDSERAVIYLQERHGLSSEMASLLYADIVCQTNSAFFPSITKMELIHTEGCNLACSYCFEKDMLGYRRMTPEVGRRAVDLLLAYSGESPEITITHFGGEPTVNFSAVRSITEYAESASAQAHKDVRFSMTSNGVLFDEAKAEYCSEHSIMVLLSVDGLKESHDSFRRDKHGRGTFDAVMKGMHRLKATQKWIGAKLTVMPQNAPRMYDDIVGLYELGVNQFVIGYATGIEWSDGEMRIFSEQLGKVYEWYRSEDRQDLRIAEFDDEDAGLASHEFGCQAGNDSITVAVDGQISPCSKILALNNRALLLKLGDVSYGLTHLRNRMELSGAPRLRASWEAQAHGDPYQGGCWATNFSDNGNVFSASLQDQHFKLLQRAACAGCASCK